MALTASSPTESCVSMPTAPIVLTHFVNYLYPPTKRYKQLTRTSQADTLHGSNTEHRTTPKMQVNSQPRRPTRTRTFRKHEVVTVHSNRERSNQLCNAQLRAARCPQ
eukprot:6214047-Pleurochrysis_carterae.AAC.1